MRIAAQCVYYFTAAAKLGRPPIFVVPTGNFGDVFAGEAAMRMGLGVEELVVATNANDIMARALNDGVYAAGDARPTLSPSMDIQVASNFERALFEASGRDAGWVAQAMDDFRARAASRPAGAHHDGAARALCRLRASTMPRRSPPSSVCTRQTGRLIDPHTAVGLAAAAKLKGRTTDPVVVLATAHAAKFPEAVNQATGISCPLPERLRALYENEERASVLPRDGAAVRAFIETRLSRP